MKDKTSTNRLGEENINTQGLKMWIKEYINSRDIDIEFEDGFISYNRKYFEFKKGQVSNKNFKIPQPKGIGLIDRTGEVEYNNRGSRMEIIEYINAQNVIIRFDNGYIIKCAYGDFKKGKPKSPYDITVCGVGYIGEGKYKTSIGDKHTLEYGVWKSIIQRCYNENKQNNGSQSYIGCSVDKEWLNFQTFAKWFNENYYKVGIERMTVDKDILHKNNKIYSPKNCMIVPNNINCLFIREKSRRGDYPIGVSLSNNRLRARMKKLIDGKCTEIHLGYFDTPEQAFEKYKIEKEKHIKEVANDYKDQIPERLYIAMINYKVEITD
jgi:hypothetical protein